MTKFRTITSGLILTVAAVGTWQAGEPAPGVAAVVSTRTSTEIPVSSNPSLTVTGGNGADHRRLDEALARFNDAGLHLPDLDVVFADDDTECRGHYGLFLATTTPWRVLICADLEFLPTHELAHAWEAAHLDDDDRRRYVEARGLTNWNDAGATWMERGIEDAAFVIHKNLTTTGGNLESAAWRERIAAYELLTGQPSPLSG